MTDKYILVTGGAGYIGSQTNLMLLEAGYKTIVLDNLVYGHREVVPKESIFIEGDLGDTETLDEVFETYPIAAVIHFAAFAYVGESVTNPEKYYYNNFVSTLNLLAVMKAHKVDKIVFSSTCATYGIPEKLPITEETPQNPINPYGRTKLMIEQVFKDYHTAYGLNSVSLRYFNACGADELMRTGESHDPETHLIPLILQVAKGERDKIVVMGDDYPTPDGTCIRDYIHTKDLGAAHIQALKKLLHAHNLCEFYNLGSGSGFSVLEIIRAVEKITGNKIIYEIGKRREGDPAQLVADLTKAKNELHFEPKYSNLDYIIQTAWNWEKINNLE